MKRIVYQELKNWKSNGRGLPLIVLGPRFSGKTKLIKEFGKKEFKQVVYINFEEMSEIKELFDGSLSIDDLLYKTSQLLGFFEIYSNDTLFIIEEIQACPTIIPLIKYVHEQIPPFFLIITSSNPGDLSNINISNIYSKIKIINLSFLSFNEYLNNVDHNLYKKHLEINAFNNLDKILHNQLVNELNNYLIIGGMPEAIIQWKVSKNFYDIEKIHINNINKIKNDFVNYGPKFSSEKLFAIFDSVPEQIMNKKFQYSKIKNNKNGRARELQKLIDWLSLTSILKKVYQVDQNFLPLENHKNSKNFRLYMGDVGMVKSALKINNDDIFSQKDFNNKRSLLLNFVFLELNKIFLDKLFFFTFNRFDLDFLISYKDLLIPIDIKSSNINHSTSLNNYIRKFNPKISIRFSFGYLKFDNGILNIPFYLIHKTVDLIEQVLNK